MDSALKATLTDDEDFQSDTPEGSAEGSGVEASLDVTSKSPGLRGQMS